MNTKDLFFKDGDVHFSDGERYLLTHLLTNKVWEDLINAKDVLLYSLNIKSGSPAYSICTPLMIKV